MTAVEAAAPAIPALTLADELARLAPGQCLAELAQWPPDAFAFTGSVLAASGAYRCIVDPPPGRSWPPTQFSTGSWETELLDAARSWAAAAGAGGAPAGPPERLLASLEAASSVPLAELDLPERWETLVDVLHLHALADEAAAGAGLAADTPLRRRAAALLGATGSLSRFPGDRVRVLPKLRPPASGMTLRSLSHHLALDRSEVEARWLVAPPGVDDGACCDRLTLLLVPHPTTIRSSDFRAVGGPLARMDELRYGFYEFAPQQALDPADVVGLAERARLHVGEVDAVVLPEGALDEAEVPELQGALAAAGVRHLIAGVRRAAAGSGGFGGNYAHFGSGDWAAPPQHKHHRWCLDGGQVHQYHLGASLDPGRRWWEAIGLPRRSLTFVTVSQRLTICPLVCEDLARPDPVTDVVRSVAPTLVVALLLDGPQLAARWPARYASVLADDPGCSVLTLTALGMALRSQPPGTQPSRAIALWKDPRRGLQQIEVAPGARAVALTAHARTVRVPSADGRMGKETAELVLSGIEQID